MDDFTEGAGIEPISDLVVALMGQGAQILEHMGRHENPVAPPIPVVLRGLLLETLRPLAERHAASALALAAEVLLDVQRTVSEEIYLVDTTGSDLDG